MDTLDKLALMPWPVALLIIMTGLISVFIIYVFLPLLDEVKRLRDLEENKLNTLISKLEELDTNIYRNVLETLNSLNIHDDIINEFAQLKNFNNVKFQQLLNENQEILVINRQLIADINKLSEDCSKLLNLLERIGDNESRDLTTIKEKLNDYYRQLDTIREKIYQLIGFTSSSRPQIPGSNNSANRFGDT